uniref:g6f-like isoform X2 n=1 Tax=Doryrhamphus excisus TaxID=161450 RepID=UPI0025ADDD36|nr:g6f-like isoform X2 [Doryrhamphus excisus]
MMEYFFLTFVLLASTFLYSACVGATDTQDWDEVVVRKEGTPIILKCIVRDTRAEVDISWLVQLHSEKDWELALSAKEHKILSGSAYKPSMRFVDQDRGDFSLFFQPTKQDAGLYMCLSEQDGWQLKVATILVAIISVTVIPANPIPQQSTLCLIARVTPEYAVHQITWESPNGRSLKTERKPNTGIVAKLPQVTYSDAGLYKCSCLVLPEAVFDFEVNVVINAVSVASFTNVVHSPPISMVTDAMMPFHLTCPDVQGDYILLYWQNPKSTISELVYHYDRWRGTTLTTAHSQDLQLDIWPNSLESGGFSFFLMPDIQDGGLYICDVFLNDHAFSQRTLLNVLKVTISRWFSNLELDCLYSSPSDVLGAMWEHQNKSHELEMVSSGPGSVTTYLPLPITSDTAGNYTCTLQLTNGQTVSITHMINQRESVSVPAPSSLSSLSALLLLVPLFATAVAVLLWRQKHITNRGEAENIYENPEDVRQVAPPGSVYMDLKPRKDDVYKELERSEQCQS